MIPCTSRKALLAAILLLVSGIAGVAQEIPAQDLGSAGLLQALTRLKTTGRLLHSTAHPDDDDGSMLTYESRHEGADTLMLTLNRGEGGQNKVGSELFDQLGVLRTLELLEADLYYGTKQRFTRVVDFGFSKNAPETFEKWGGHDAALEDMVRVIRQFRPDVIVSRFSGTPADGHGNHQAAGILSREAFKAAADPSRFPEQIRGGLLPWQVKKLYTGNPRANDKDSLLRLDTGTYDPVLGMSYAQLSVEGLRHQASQGVGGVTVSSGPSFRNYKLIESVLPPSEKPEKSFFDGIDTSIPGLAARIGQEAEKTPFLLPALKAIDRSVHNASAAFDAREPSHSAPALLQGLAQVRELLGQIQTSSLSPATRTELVNQLETKEQQFEDAANLALGTELVVTVDSGENRSSSPFFRQEQTLLTATPGETFTATATFFNRGKQQLTLRDISLETPPGWKVDRLKGESKLLASNQSAAAQFRITVSENAEYTRPYWQRNDDSESVYQILNPKYVTMALPPWPVSAVATYALPNRDGDGASGEGSKRSLLEVKFIDPIYGQMERPLPVGPPLSVEVENPVQVVSLKHQSAIDVRVDVRNQVHGAASAQVKLEAPPGWQEKAPAGTDVKFNSESELKSVRFELRPPKLEQGYYDLKASAGYDGQSYDQGVSTIGRNDIGYFYYYRPASQRISAVDVNVPGGLRVGYIMGAGDAIPGVLQQLGIAVSMITPDQLANGDLGRFDTIVVGIRAYDVRSDIRQYNSRLLDYVHRGGTLIVQYNSGTAQFNMGHYTPYPASLMIPRRPSAGSPANRPPESDRVTDENAPVQLLAPQNPLLSTPNRITERDFQGWVQERGLYFMKQWDSHFEPLLASGDPGEEPLKGGLLVAHYGKGTYIFTGLAFFRQLPAGVPGAIRLFANLLSAGHSPSANSAKAARTAAAHQQAQAPAR